MNAKFKDCRRKKQKNKKTNTIMKETLAVLKQTKLFNILLMTNIIINISLKIMIQN